jgi:hypothetical protein
MKTVQALGLDQENVERVLVFLLDRAASHDEDESGDRLAHRLCAATLRRDAAALAIILENYPKARHLLRISGTEYLEEKSFYGLVLLALTEGSPPWEMVGDQVADLSRRFYDTDEHDLTGSRSRSLSSLEMISALQALSATAQRTGNLEDLRRNLSEVFQHSPAASGSPELRSRYYFALLDRVAGDAGPKESWSVGREASLISAIREEDLDAARADEYHWPLLLNPSDIVGFDLMLLAFAALRHGQQLDQLVEAFGGIDSPVALPFKAAVGITSQ